MRLLGDQLFDQLVRLVPRFRIEHSKSLDQFFPRTDGQNRLGIKHDDRSCAFVLRQLIGQPPQESRPRPFELLADQLAAHQPHGVHQVVAIDNQAVRHAFIIAVLRKAGGESDKMTRYLKQ